MIESNGFFIFFPSQPYDFKYECWRTVDRFDQAQSLRQFYADFKRIWRQTRQNNLPIVIAIPIRGVAGASAAGAVAVALKAPVLTCLAKNTIILRLFSGASRVADKKGTHFQRRVDPIPT